jgi:hypothetical protein
MSVARLVLVAILVGGCSVAPTGSLAGSLTESPPTKASATASFSLPSGFPVLPGALPVPLPSGDPGLIGLWASELAGSAAYDFYAEALPAAGYPIIGLYPGGEFAIIRFRVPTRDVWQMVVRGMPEGRVAIEIRLDRP